ncbi:aromatic-ring hydroxylase C-terminal domain-containing protein [Streptomyces nojiriensis]|uniref:aromatic-ring hydroxylase C-terminal domain-containing protein n=1 Tax=Streptomyces nojiriensis TaxID=66374 RepID=UPI003665BB91
MLFVQSDSVALPDTVNELTARVSGGAQNTERLTALAVSYRPTEPREPTAHPVTGTRAPDLAFIGSETGLFALLRADAHLLLALTPDSGRSDLERPGLVVHTGTLHQPPAAWTQVSAALIRPDGHVAWAATAADGATLAAAVDQALAARPFLTDHLIVG